MARRIREPPAARWRCGTGGVAAAVALVGLLVGSEGAVGQVKRRAVALPKPALEGDMSLETAIAQRESQREFEPGPLTPAALGQLLWAAQGTTTGGRRTVPSAGALYPIEVYAVVGLVEGIAPGVYHYRPTRHDLVLVEAGDRRDELATAAFQDWVADAPVTLVIAAVLDRTAVKYGSRAQRYVHMEVGCVAANVYLQATALHLGTTLVGAFTDRSVKRVLSLPAEHAPLGLMPVGR
ncbi:MAG: SagB/ThcOx family dehydrogenase [Gemmatimonadota bacterium]|nr:SagB/ThcOx family dehydrogenase [Gemmatimonadota bacterium]